MSLAKKQNHAPNKSINPVTSNISPFISAIEFPDATNIIISVIDIRWYGSFDLHYREKIRIIKLPAIVVDITNLQHSSWEIRNDAEEIVLSELAYI